MDAPGETSQKPNRLITAAIVVFWALVGVFPLLMAHVFQPMEGSPRTADWICLFNSGLIIVLVLGIALIILAALAKMPRALKVFLIIVGSAVVAFPVSFELHGLVYRLGVMWFGEGAFGGHDEPFFFIMALVVCPIVFLVGFVGSIVTLTLGKLRRSA